jgi:hypothetical protein
MIMSETIIKIADKTENFTIVANEVPRRSDLSARAKGIYFYLMTLPKDWIVRKEEIYTHFVEGRDSLDTAWAELVKTGYIHKEFIREQGVIKGTKWLVYESSRITEKPISANQLTEKPISANTQLLNTDTTLNTYNKVNNTQQEEKNKYGEYKHVLLTKPQYEKLILDLGENKTKEYIKKLDEGIELKGYKYKNHNLAIRHWISNDSKKTGIYSSQNSYPKKTSSVSAPECAFSMQEA